MQKYTMLSFWNEYWQQEHTYNWCAGSAAWAGVPGDGPVTSDQESWHRLMVRRHTGRLRGSTTYVLEHGLHRLVQMDARNMREDLNRQADRMPPRSLSRAWQYMQNIEEYSTEWQDGEETVYLVLQWEQHDIPVLTRELARAFWRTYKGQQPYKTKKKNTREKILEICAVCHVVAPAPLPSPPRARACTLCHPLHMYGGTVAYVIVCNWYATVFFFNESGLIFMYIEQYV